MSTEVPRQEGMRRRKQRLRGAGADGAVERPGGHRETLAEALKGRSLEPREGARPPTAQSQTMASTLGEHTFQFFSVPQDVVLCHGSPRKQIPYPNSGKELEIDFSPNISISLMRKQRRPRDRKAQNPRSPRKCVSEPGLTSQSPAWKILGFFFFSFFFLSSPGPSWS